MKKFISIFMSALMLCGVLSATAFATEETTEVETSAELTLKLEYMDFYENQDYYMDLVRDKDYTLCIDVPEEYQELEEARIAEGANDTDEMVPDIARGAGIPTVGHSILQGSYTFKGEATYTNLYTEKYVYGNTQYIVTVNNSRYGNQALTCKAFNVVSNSQFTCNAGSTVVKKLTMKGSGPTAISAHLFFL